MAIYTPERKFSSELDYAGTLILDVQLLELWENTFLLFKPPSLWYFVLAAQADWYQLFPF